MANAGLRAFSSVLEGVPEFQQNVAGAVNRQQEQKRKQTKFQRETDAYDSGVESIKLVSHFSSVYYLILIGPVSSPRIN